MNEKLQNIIDGINNGTIKDVSSFDLTLEDFLAKDNNGTYFLEFLLKKHIILPFELEYKMKNNPEIAYIYCKNDEYLYFFNISEKDLFSYFNGVRLIDYLIEKNSLISNFIQNIKENIEIVDLLCSSGHYFMLNFLNPDIINKLTIKNEYGVFPIEKYLNDENAIKFIVPLVNNLNVLLEICNKNNNYNLMQYANESILMSNYEDNKSILQFLIKDKGIIPKCLIDIPANVDFIKYLLDNNYYDYLKNVGEDIFLLEIFSTETLLEFMLKHGYDPQLKNIYNVKTINIIYRFKRFDLIEEVSENILLTPVKEIFDDDSDDSRSLFEYMLDNGYNIKNFCIQNENLVKLCYFKKRPDLLIKTNISNLLKPIHDNYTYLDYILNCIKNANVKINITNISCSSDIDENVKYYITVAKHDMIAYLNKIEVDTLLKKYGDKTLLEILLDTDMDLTLNKILTNTLKSNPDIAIILRNRGINQKDVDISKKENEYTASYIKNINNNLGVGPLLKEGEDLLKKLEFLFSSDNKSDKDMVNGLIAGYRNALMVNYDVTIEEINRLIDIKEQNLDRFCYFRSNDGNYFSPQNGSVFCERANINSLMHETGHALHYYLANNKIPDNYMAIIDRAKEDVNILFNTEMFSISYQHLVSKSYDSVNQRYEGFIKEYYTDQKIKDIEDRLPKSKEEKKLKYKGLQISDEQLDIILDDMYTLNEYIEHQKRIFIKENVFVTLLNDFSGFISIGDILDAIYDGRLHSGILKNSQGSLIPSTCGHGLNYYYATEHGFYEMIANFSAIAKSNKAEDNLLFLKSIIGDEVFNMIYDFYYYDILNFNRDKLENLKFKGGK